MCLDKPRFQAGLPTVVHSWEGRIQNISCNATAHPAPSIEWLHNDHSLTSNVTYHIYEATPGISLLEVSVESFVFPIMFLKVSIKILSELISRDGHISHSTAPFLA